MRPSIRYALAAVALAAPCLAHDPNDNTPPFNSPAVVFAPGSTLAPTASWSDDFNRPDGTPLGASWTQMSGSHGVINSTGYSLGTGTGWVQHGTGSILYSDARMTLDFLPKVQGANLVFVACVIGVASNTDNVFMKVQDNNSDGTYETIYFYRGINGNSWSGVASGTSMTPTVSGRMTCYITDNGDTANIDVDYNFDGVVDHHAQKTGVLGFAAALGTGIGISTYNSPAFDNWSATDTALPPITVYCTAGTTTHSCAASLGYSGTPSAAATSGFTITAGSVEGQSSGIFFYGVSGPVAVPWAAGSSSFLCVKTPLQRTAIQNSGGNFGQCDGTLSYDFLAFMAANPLAVGQPIAPGQQFHTQAWFRDPPAVKSTNLSDALDFTLVP